MTIHVNLKLLQIAFLAGALSLSGAGDIWAQSKYSKEDAAFVTSSKNQEVLQYIVCLEGRVEPGVPVDEALKLAARDCQMLALRIPVLPGEPDAATILDMVRECGFRPGQASPDAGCGNEDVSPPAAADMVTLTPTIIELGKWTEGVAVEGKWIWAAESGARKIARIDRATGEVVDRVKVGRLPVAMVAPGDGRVYALVQTDRKIWQQPAKGKGRNFASLSGCPNDMAASQGSLWVLTEPDCSSAGSQLIRVDLHSGRQAVSTNLGEWGQAIVAHGRDIWVAHAREPALRVVDQKSLRASEHDLGGVSLWSIASNGANVFGGGRVEGTDNQGLVVMFDPDSMAEIGRATLTERIAEIACDDEHVVAVGGQGTIWVFSADNLVLKRRIVLSIGAFDPRALILDGNRLVLSASTYKGENGAVLVVDDFLH